MRNKLRPVIQVRYCPIKKDWDQKIRDELRRRGLKIADLKKYTVFAIPETSRNAPLYQDL